MSNSIHALMRPLGSAQTRLPEETSPRAASPASPASLAGDLNSRLAVARPRLARLARLNGATADQAEDVAQESLLTAWRSLDHLRAADRFDAWLDGICRNITRQAVRRDAQERDHLAHDDAADAASADPHAALAALDDLPADAADPLDTLTHQELVALLDSALGHLNAATREAVSLRYLADMPTDETAARLNVTVNTLEARLSRARKQLRAALNGPLRERAIEFGLALAPADEAGWRDTSIWCHFCGQARMRGILRPALDGGGSLSLQCPACWRNYGVTETSIPSMPELAGVTSFRPAMKRVLAHGVVWNDARHRLETTCFQCGRPLPVRMGRIGDFPEVGLTAPLFADHYSALYECAPCRGIGSGAAAIAGRTHPQVRRFMLERQRWMIEPDQRVEFEGAPTIRFTLHDLATDQRIIFFSDPTTLAVRAVIEP
ncbi:MAG TPA: sigma-70 family RNA polymerase sigma factor [Ktedonobacterales bacterium]|nr:sigma-70 family RNA polymerase sigma factor [Ktedonobacterales bacterium]